MEISAWIAGRRGAVPELARQLGVSAPVVWQWTAGRRPIPVERCPAIERATGGKVMRWHLRPNDWWRIWPELVGRPDAPAVPVEGSAGQDGASGTNAQQEAA